MDDWVHNIKRQQGKIEKRKYIKTLNEEVLVKDIFA